MKVLVALETTQNPKYAERRAMIESTWARRMPPGFTFESFDGKRLGVPDDYNGLCQKTRAIARYALKHDYERLLIVDDDCYVRTERLTVPDCDYGGHCLPVSPDDDTYCAGFFYWLSRRAIRIVAEAPLNPRWNSAEDQWAAWALREKGILPTRLTEAVMERCPCGKCPSKPEPTEWTCYVMWFRFSPDLFRRFEQLYGLTAKP